jgi:hypothetical protein
LTPQGVLHRIVLTRPNLERSGDGKPWILSIRIARPPREE